MAKIGVVDRIGRIRRGVAVPATIDRAVAKPNKLINRLARGRTIGSDDQSRSRGSAQLEAGEAHTTAPAVKVSSAESESYKLQ
jgi:hypothetical protein